MFLSISLLFSQLSLVQVYMVDIQEQHLIAIHREMKAVYTARLLRSLSSNLLFNTDLDVQATRTYSIQRSKSKSTDYQQSYIFVQPQTKYRKSNPQRHRRPKSQSPEYQVQQNPHIPTKNSETYLLSACLVFHQLNFKLSNKASSGSRGYLLYRLHHSARFRYLS